MSENPENHFKQEVARKAERLERAERRKATLIGQTVYAGMIGLVFVLPIVGGAYLGRWIDDLASGYSVRWTVSMILLGIAIGGLNVYWLIKE